jgi:predicted secreted protein
MLRIRTEIFVAGINCRQITDFLLDCADERYQQWWPGIHRRFHPLVLGQNHVGDEVLMDEYVGGRRIRMTGVVLEAIPGEQVVWQLKRGVRLPVRLTLELADRDGGVALRHTITAGYRGIGRVLDPLLRLYFSPAFATAMDEHVRTEFPLLRDLLAHAQARPTTRANRAPPPQPASDIAVRARHVKWPPCRPKVANVADRVRDERGGRVVFVSHCLLNENVRYLGGATRPGAVAELVERYIANGVGIYQMPCPEQHAWGGVLKPRMLRLYGAPLLRIGPVSVALAVAARGWMHVVYGRLARQVVTAIADYIASGMTVVEIVGVAASPSCGVNTTLNLSGALRAMADCDPATIDRTTVNRHVVAGSVEDGSGVFIAALCRQLRRHNLPIRFVEHNLLAEIGTVDSDTPVTVR